jgi:hypothetical protein
MAILGGIFYTFNQKQCEECNFRTCNPATKPVFELENYTLAELVASRNLFVPEKAQENN